MALAPIPAVPDSERRTRYVLTAPSSATMQVGFAIWASGSDYANWIEIWQNGVKLPNTAWTLTHPSGPLANLPRPITAAIVNPQVPFSGTIDIVGAERPRRPILFSEGVGVPARDHNRTYNDHTAIAREGWDQRYRTLRGAPGEVINPIPPVVTRKTKTLGFDTAGHPIVSDKTMDEIDDAVDLIKYLEGLLAGLQKGNPNLVILSSVDALRNLTVTTVTASAAFVQAYYNGGDSGGGLFRQDIDDTTSLDDKGLIIVDASNRRWKRVVGAFATLDMFGNPTVQADLNAVASACYAQKVPLSLKEALVKNTQTPPAIQLRIDPLVGLTGPGQDRQAWARIHEALEWVAGCSKRGQSDLELHIFTANQGPIPVYGQYIHNYYNTGGSDVGAVSVNMPEPLSTDLDMAAGTSVTFVGYPNNRRSEVIGIRLQGGGSRAGKGYTVPPLVTVVPKAGYAGSGCTAEAYLDPNPPAGLEGRLGGIRVITPGSGWNGGIGKPPDVILTPNGGAIPTGANVAKAEASVNEDIFECIIWVLNAPTNIQVGTPFGVHGYGGTLDCGAINGAHVVKQWIKNVSTDAWWDATTVTIPATPTTPERIVPSPTNNTRGGRIRFDMTGSRRELAGTYNVSDPMNLRGGEPLNNAGSQASTGVYIASTWLKSTGGWFGAGSGEGLFSANGDGTLSLRGVSATFEVNGPGIDTGIETPNPGTTDQCFVNTGRDGAMAYMENRCIGVGFPGSGVRIARGAIFMNNCHIGGGIKQAGESYLALQVQNGGWFGVSYCSFGSSNSSVVAVQGGTSGYITHCSVGAGAKGIQVYGWADIQVTKVYSCAVGIECLAGGKAYALYRAPKDYVAPPVPPALPSAARTAYLTSLVSTEVIRSTLGLKIAQMGWMFARIRMDRCGPALTSDSSSDVPIGTSAFGGGYFGASPDPEDLVEPINNVVQNQTVQVLQLRREAGYADPGAGNSVTLNKPAGVITWTPSIAAGANETLSVSSVYVNVSSIIKCSLQYEGNAGMPILAAIEPLPTSFRVKVWNAGTAALNGDLKVFFEIDELFEQGANTQDPESVDQAEPELPLEEIIGDVDEGGGEGEP